MAVRSRNSLVLSSSLVLAAACGGDPGNDPDQLVGTWREIPSLVDGDVPLEERDRLIVGADGSYQVVEPDGVQTGTYTADDRDITLSEGGETITMQYVVTDDRLLVGALTPDGDVDGLVGTWAGTAQRGDEHISLVLELRADETARYERDSSDPTGDGDEVLEGTWRRDGGDLVTTYEIPSQSGGTITVNLHMQEIPGRALGSPLFERI